MTHSFSWKERVLYQTHEIACDLVFNQFAPDRISNLIKDGELTIDEIVDEFAKNLRSCLEE